MIFFILNTIIFFPLVSKLIKNKSIIFLSSISFLLGSFITTYTLFLLFLLGFPLSAFVYYSLLGCYALVNFSFFSTNFVNVIKQMPTNKKLILLPIEKILLTISIILFLLYTVYSIYWPVRDWDALTLYDFRAQVIYKTNSIQPLEKL